MALREVFHVVATQFPVEPDHFNSATDSNEIREGMAVRMDTNGYVKRGNNTNPLIGLAGDSLSQTGGFTEPAADIVINPSGGTRSSSNRVSDFFDETSASSKMTVYMAGGEFLTDQYESSANWDAVTIGDEVFCQDGKVSPTNTGWRVGYLLGRPAELESGVPGTDVRGSISSGQFIRIALSIDPS